jgi:vancomycin resistance protein VanW
MAGRGSALRPVMPIAHTGGVIAEGLAWARATWRGTPHSLRDATPAQLAVRATKVALLGARRRVRWWTEPGFAPPVRVVPRGDVVRELRVPIARSGAHPALEAGKRHNLRLAAAAFHGVVISPAAPLSFWRTLGPATAARGFLPGMEVRSGCVVPAIGGGLCLLSNALYTLALELGWTILERHGHTMALADADANDATVFYPQVDLRVAPTAGEVMLDVAVRGDVLVLAVRSEAPVVLPRVELQRQTVDDAGVRTRLVRRRIFVGEALAADEVVTDDRQRIPPKVKTCLDCGETGCHARTEMPLRAEDLGPVKAEGS